MSIVLCKLAICQTFFLPYNGRSVTESQPIRLLGIVNLALGYHMAWLAVLIENGVTNLQILHGGKAVRRRNLRIESQLMLSILVDTFYSRDSWTMLQAGENRSISFA